MKHHTYDEWLQYVKNEVNEKTREVLESHLYMCDKCLDDYLQAMAANESLLPILFNESTFTDLVMAGVSKQKTELQVNWKKADKDILADKQPLIIKSKTENKQSNNSPNKNHKKPLYQQVAFHYLLAAAATILLMFSGTFQSLVTYANAIESPQIQEKKTSVTGIVINKTFAWMDSLEKKEANKK
jgi:hypothetical protein